MASVSNTASLLLESEAKFELTDSGENQLSGKIWIAPNLAYFAGHFPDNPILPGVVQVHWAALVTQWHYECLPISAFCGMSNIKFKSRITPDSWTQLTLTRNRRKVTFHYETNSNSCTQGQLIYHE